MSGMDVFEDPMFSEKRGINLIGLNSDERDDHPLADYRYELPTELLELADHAQQS
ncbi:hypothetical protein [Pseudomonas sp. PD9R]|uniref:hypothetical protein n=1 Tax=Pseudomonas sp. PD9R TaxID=2853534 RepID=UPI001C43FB1A|nr:hypothetical protein [Pseudomonas sp. PD9R]MBV6821655.1 hypothetical protein [Pseudomonas sp. PD9R]